MSRKVLALFFTRGVALQTWIDRGMFDREKRTYEKLLHHGHLDEVLWLTYGPDDLTLAQRLIAEGALAPGIKVLPMPAMFASKWGKLLYSLLAPIIYRRELQSASVFKTNQMDGAWTAWVAKLLWKKPFYLRTGFTWSLFEIMGNPEKKWRIRLASAIEKFLYRRADVASVSSRNDHAYITRQIGATNLHVMPNYVDTAKFAGTHRDPVPGGIVFVGRLHPQKNLDVFIKSLTGSRWDLHIYGEGPEKPYLKEVADAHGVSVTFHGFVPNSELPEIFSRAAIFALPSVFEGMPKALLEAMACGCLCLGADVPGVSEVIEDGVNGFLAETPTEAGFKAALERIETTEVATLRQIEKNGASHICAAYSLNNVVKQESKLLEPFYPV